MCICAAPRPDGNGLAAAVQVDRIWTHMGNMTTCEMTPTVVTIMSRLLPQLLMRIWDDRLGIYMAECIRLC